mgnify:CR=1 FL=1
MNSLIKCMNKHNLINALVGMVIVMSFISPLIYFGMWEYVLMAIPFGFVPMGLDWRD